MISRSNVTMQGGGATMGATKLVRGAGMTDPLIKVHSPGTLTGITLQNFTVCGSSNLATTPGGPPLSPMSSVGCPRVPTTCQTYTESWDPPTGPICTDLELGNVTTGQYPSDPFASAGPYGVTINKVDFEDATGHAISMWNATPNKANDIYIHDSEVNLSAVTGILYNSQTQYHANQCAYAGFANDQNVFLPFNLRIEDNKFTGNRTGVMGGGARWVKLRHNVFTGNYTYPQVGNPGGGTIEFDVCSDTVHIIDNDFFGPGTFEQTDAMELYARNLDIRDNRISGYPAQGISLSSTYNPKVIHNILTNNGLWPNSESGGFAVSTAPGTLIGPCGDPREATGLDLSGGNETSGTNQKYGLMFLDIFDESTSRVNMTTLSNNTLGGTIAQVAKRSTVVLDGYSQDGNTSQSSIVSLPREFGPRALTVLAVSPLTSRCSLVGNTRQTFKFPAGDAGGVGNINWIQGIFSKGTKVPNIPGDRGSIKTITNVEGCHFYYDRASNTILLNSGQPGGTNWIDSSVVGSGGHTLSNGYCNIYAASSTSGPDTSIPWIYNLTLDVEFPFSASSAFTKHISSITGNYLGQQSNLGNWSYFGWWNTP